MMLQIQTKCLFSQTCGFFITFIVFLSLVKIVWCLFVIWNKEKEQQTLLFSFYSALSLCSDRCKSKSRPRVQTLRMYTQLWISSTEYKITSFRVTYCRIPAELHGSTSYSGYLAGNALKFSCIKARRRLYHRSAKTVFRYCCIIYISFSVISRSAVEV